MGSLSVAATATAPAYTEVPLDRAGDRRTDPEWVAEILASGDTVVIPLWRDRCLLDAARVPLQLTGAQARLGTSVEQWVLLGLDSGGPGAGTGQRGEPAVAAADLSGLTEAAALELTGATETAPTREPFTRLSARDAALLACARGYLHWHRQQRYCGVCGRPTESVSGGHERRCGPDGCGKRHFPRVEPAVIVLVEAPGPPGRCLLARHRGAPPHAYSLLAGFVETGEGLEGAAVREVGEEAGVRVGSVSYVGSQGWPFPSGLMAGFHARATHDELRPDKRELIDARWFTRDELRARVRAGHGLGPPDSLGSRMLRDWLER
ncbi:NAD(+) diphosphatase [Streptomyces sp. AJS327]|uniref:NAD(+) diphosphatase n=1 Tax=Streptomyces sp. AJS327 TaxID=2545265 RepID=UPI0015DDF29F|nr:NAD(+) diphosphatase [Streptomyces sp. AJS327]MBA0051706.1 NAD(+) diphosphatase [Streptomyces sp. AJS327]